jgi:hypothetical protein
MRAAADASEVERERVNRLIAKLYADRVRLHKNSED